MADTDDWQEFKPGDIVDDTYLLKESIGEGGMGAVFRAQHQILKKDFALKILPKDKISEITWKRFTLEARAIAKMDHPSIVKIHNMGIDPSGIPYYVMDLLRGITLMDLCRSEDQTALADVITLFYKIAAGLQYAHNKGFIHRDIKPSNIMLLPNNNQVDVKIVDFGIAKLAPGNAAKTQTLTKTGEIFGSPLYMSPEQSLSEACDRRSDIYSLGCTLYEVLTKKPPFKGKTAMETMMMHQTAPIPSLAAALSEQQSQPLTETELVALDTILAKMLAKDPRRRYPSMNEFIHDLTRLSEGKPVFVPFSVNHPPSDHDYGNDDDTTGQWTEQPQKTSPLDRRGLIVALTAAGLICAAIMTFVVLKSAKQNQPAPPQDNLPLIESHIVTTKDGRKKQILFPDRSIGTVSVRSRDEGDTTIVGKHLKTIPIGAKLGLDVSPDINPYCFNQPQVYARIGPHEFSQLSIYKYIHTSRPKSAVPPDPLFQKNALYILDKASTWTNLESLELLDLSLENPEQMSVFNRYKTPTKLYMQHCTGLAQEQISGTNLLHNLKTLSIEHCGNPDNFLTNFAPKAKINTLILSTDDITSDTIAILTNFKGLENLRLDGTKTLSEKQIIDLGSLKELRDVCITAHPLSKEQIDQWLSKSTRTVLTLRKDCYQSGKDIIETYRDNPRVRFK